MEPGNRQKNRAIEIQGLAQKMDCGKNYRLDYILQTQLQGLRKTNRIKSGNDAIGYDSNIH